MIYLSEYILNGLVKYFLEDAPLRGLESLKRRKERNSSQPNEAKVGKTCRLVC